MKEPKYQYLTPGGSGNSDRLLTHQVAKGMIKVSDRLKDQTIDLAVRLEEAEAYLDVHTDYVKESWVEVNKAAAKVLEDLRLTRMAIGNEAERVVKDLSDVRKFFLADEHEKEIARLKEFIELCERIRALKNDGTLDKVADTILKLA